MNAEDAGLRRFLKVIVALNGLRGRDGVAFAEAIRMARDPGHVPAAGSLPVLKGWGLLGGDGAMGDDTRAAVLSSRYAQEATA